MAKEISAADALALKILSDAKGGSAWSNQSLKYFNDVMDDLQRVAVELDVNELSLEDLELKRLRELQKVSKETWEKLDTLFKSLDSRKSAPTESEYRAMYL